MKLALILPPGKMALLVVIVGLGLGLSWWQRLQLERDLLEGTVRTVLQLIAVGLILDVVFRVNHWYDTAGVLAVMILVAGQNASRRGKGLPGIFRMTTLSILTGTVVTLGLLVSLGIIPSSPRYVIPVGGMIVGNAMIASGLVLNRYRADLRRGRPEVETWLSLGASPRAAVRRILREAVRGGMIPTVDSMKTVGLVTLPGMMTGSILAGASPLSAVELQVLVMLMLTSAVMVSSVMLGIFVERASFTRHEQLRRLFVDG